MKFYKSFILSLFALLVLGITSCEIDEIPDPNGASLDQIVNNASKSDLQAVVTGIESLVRKEIGFYYDVTGIIGREFYFFTGSDPRYTGELLGKGGALLDNAGFYGTRPYAGRYATVKNTNILLAAVTNNADRLGLSQAQVNGYNGFAKTMQAYELHLALNLQFQNGIRLDVSDPDNLGPFTSYDEGLRGIQNLLNDAATDLGNAGDAFDFALSSGFAGYDTPASFRTFNRALAARISLYQNDRDVARTNLQGSFLDLDGLLEEGPARSYSVAGGEETNPLFRTPNQSEALVAHPDFITDLAPNDDRAAKIQERTDSISLDDLTSTHDVVVFPSLTSSIPLINNEELILIYAEANIGNDNTETVRALDVIRTTHGLPAYTGATTDDALTDELLTQRRFSLFALGHRWVDMRRFNRLDELPLDRDGDDVWEQFPRPVSEVE